MILESCITHGVRLCGAAVLLLAAAPAARAQTPAAPGPQAGRAVEALRGDARSIELDGRLSEEVWARAAPADSFVQRRPTEGTPATERTEVRFLYTPDALYIGARMYSRDPAATRAPVGRRDNDDEQTETLLVSIDSYLDHRTAYTFGITPAGTRLDWYHGSDRESGAARSFDPVWEGRARRDSLGWTAEMRIPYTQLRFHRLPVQTWGINVRRWVPSSNEESYWVLVPRRQTGWASRFGTLTGLEGIRPTRRVELSPYVAANARYTAEPGANNPFNDGSKLGTRVGGDVKAGLGPSLTLEGTVNPDFGQVEADPAEVNLSAFETFFPERRPFFVEGSRLLLGDGPAYFYSRRIGARPRGSASGDFTDYPEATTILGATKLTGRIGARTSVGALAALTDAEWARTSTVADSQFGRVEVAPRTGFLVGRVQRDIRGSGSTAGISFTGVRRDIGAGEPLSALLTRQAYAGGGDWMLRFKDGSYELAGYVGASYVEGEPRALRAVQRSSARYFQRPDADHVELDTTRTSLAGYAGSLRLAKEGGKHWVGGTSVLLRSPGFEINDAGRLSETDLIINSGNVRYRETEAGRRLREYNFGVSGEVDHNFGGTRTYSNLVADGSVVWPNYWGSYAAATLNFPAQSDRLTRGGPLMRTPLAASAAYEMYNSGSSRTRWLLGVSVAGDELGMRRYRVSGRLSLRPGPRWQFSVNPSYLRVHDARQYVTTLLQGRAETFDRRYVFASIAQSQLAAQFRLNYALRPDLTLETYVEPFAASGSYSGFGELSAPRELDLRVYGTDGTTARRQEDGSLVVTDGAGTFTLSNPNFDVRSFRSNAVLRWEWRPGSTAFLVWQQDRFSQAGFGRTVGPRSLWDTFDSAGDNRVILKVTYWIPVR